MKELWDNVTAQHIKAAIEKFEKIDESHPEPRNTFLLFNGKKYPAKHIRGLAFELANNREIRKSEYSGGKETATFFNKRGFDVAYGGAKAESSEPVMKRKQPSVSPVSVAVSHRPTTEKTRLSAPPSKARKTKQLSVVGQKNALQRLLQIHCGHIETEKRFEWLRTPDQENLPKEYRPIVDALLKYRSQSGFKKSRRPLLCDIYVEEIKLIIEYDENQHFSAARKISLENYPNSVRLNFSKEEWISACERINAKDNNPIDRDEKRAFYDAVRDIEASKNGYKLVRIKHGDVDWESKESVTHLKSLTSATHTIVRNKENSMEENPARIARLIPTESECDYFGNPIESKSRKLIDIFLASEHGKNHYDIIVTPGGFLTFDFPKRLQYDLDVNVAEKNYVADLQNEAQEVISLFFRQMKPSSLRKLKETADYFSIGIDGFNRFKKHIEFVAIYELKSERIISWTGKFYPTEAQKGDLIKFNDLGTHFLQLNNHRVVVLGCHDLNVFSPRGQANANPNGWKRKIADEFKNLCQEFQPDIIIQHPHTTDTPKIWNLPWRAVERELPSVKHFASGINYLCRNGAPRGKLKDVLDSTKKGNVHDFFL